MVDTVVGLVEDIATNYQLLILGWDEKNILPEDHCYISACYHYSSALG